MSYTDPTIRATGDLITASIWNTDVVNNFKALSQVGTAFPASPATNDRFLLVDSTTNPSYQWMFRYNGGSTSPYKWEYIGGSALVATADPYTLPAHAGDWAIQAKGYFGNGGTTTGADETASLVVGGLTVDTTVQNGPSSAASGTGSRGMAAVALAAKATGVSASASVSLGLNSPVFVIRPIRLS